jgi:hypothetical protein
MHKATWLLAVLLAIGLTSCHDNTTAPVVAAPAAPRGLYSITGDRIVTLRWLANTEPRITGYRVYQSDSATSRPYVRVGATAETFFIVTGLQNGTRRFFAVSAVDAGGNESALSYETVYDTPRPQGTGAVMANALRANATGWDFSAMRALPWNNTNVDYLYSRTKSGFAEIYAAHDSSDIQDVGYHETLDAVDFAPAAGWSPTASVEAIPGHCYVVWTREDCYGKFRITSADSVSVVFDWAYQTDPANGELHARRAGRGSASVRPALVTQG